MKEKDDNLFYDISGISETSGIRERAAVEYLNTALSKEFSDIIAPTYLREVML